ncbi:MAG: tetratricopeptide repeat protein [Planctomycetota bacterium]
MPLTPHERRTVTVLFARAEELEHGSAEESDAFYGILRGAVEGHGGTVDKFIGAEFMAVFGAPVAHEDDSSRAVRAALEIVDAARSRAVAVHAGLNCGEVLWGSVAGERPTAIGDPVNVAHRVMEAAPPGVVLVSRAVERACRGEVLFRSPERLEMRGRGADVETLEAWRAPSGPTEARLSPLPLTPFLGRDAEFARIMEIAARPGGGAALVRGEAGAGKSRMLAELRRELRGRMPGLRSMTGRARDAVRLPLLAFREIVTAELGAPGLEVFDPVTTAARLKSDLVRAGVKARDAALRADFIVLSLGAALPNSPARHLDPASAAAEARAAWADWFASRAREAPLLVCIEDLHWADPATLALAEHLAAALPGRGVALVASTRPEGRSLAAFEEIAVRELSPEAAAGVARMVLGGDMVPALQDWLFEKTGGNPLFIQELCAYLRDRELVKGSPLALDAAPASIPEGLQALLVARLDVLPAAEREALKAASVLGRVFGARLLSAIAGADAILAAGEALKRGLILPQDRSLIPGDAEYAFHHALFRDAAYSLLTKKDRSRLHGLAAGALLAGSPGRALRALAARHRELEGRAKDAAAIWLGVAEDSVKGGTQVETSDASAEAIRLGAGARAYVLGAGSSLHLARFPEAETLAAKALEGATSEKEAGRARILMARARFALGRSEESLADLGFVAQGGSVERRIEGLIIRADFLSRLGRAPEAAEAAAAAGAQLAADTSMPEGERAEFAVSLQSTLGQVSIAQGFYPRALEHFRNSLKGCLERGLRGRAITTEGNVGIALYELGRIEEAEVAFSNVLEAAREIGDRRAVAASLNNLSMIRRRSGDVNAAERMLVEAVALNREIGFTSGAINALHNLSQIHLDRGDPDRAEAMARQVLAEAQATGSTREINSAAGFLGNVHFFRGELDEAEPRFDEADRHAAERSDRVSAATARVDRAVCRFLRADLTGAEALARDAAGVLRDGGHPFGEARALAALAETLEAAGRMPKAEAAAAESAALWTRVGDPEFSVSAAILRCRLALARGDRPEARRRLDAAPRKGAGHEFLILRFAEARMLAAEGRIEEARSAIEAARHDPEYQRLQVVDRLHVLSLEAEALRDAGDAAGATGAAGEGLDLAQARGMAVWKPRFQAAGGRVG